MTQLFEAIEEILPDVLSSTVIIFKKIKYSSLFAG